MGDICMKMHAHTSVAGEAGKPGKQQLAIIQVHTQQTTLTYIYPPTHFLINTLYITITSNHISSQYHQHHNCVC